MREQYPWHKEVRQRLAGLRTRLPHALLLKGAQGAGKLDLAMNFAQSVLCEQPLAGGEACDACPSCHWFQQESHPDFRLIQPDALAQTEASVTDNSKKPARQITVDQVRALADFSNLSAHRGGYRVVLVYPAEAMNLNAANALLKTLEEPQGQMLFILVTHKPQHLLPTILSRCHSMPVAMPSMQASIAWLEQQAIDDPAKRLAQAGFSPLLAMDLTEESASEHEKVLRALMQPEQMDEFELAEQLKSKRVEPIQLIQWLQQWCYDLGSLKLAAKVRYHPDLQDSICRLSNGLAMFDLLKMQKELSIAKREAYHPLEPKLLFESLFAAYRQMLRIRAS
ncbi:MAG: DNA polymerase III subunit delta' [Gammaproteobacteria bacterium]|nr:DNA polymerase III subunit delta' [Gammaproteobacteria bacterium]